MLLIYFNAPLISYVVVFLLLRCQEYAHESWQKRFFPKNRHLKLVPYPFKTVIGYFSALGCLFALYRNYIANRYIMLLAG